MATMNDSPTENPTPAPDEPSAAARAKPESWLSRYRWAPYVLPLLVYMLLGSIEPKPAKTPATDGNPSNVEKVASESGSWAALKLDSAYYPHFYTLRIALTLAVMVVVSPAYREFPWKVHPLAFAVGGVGAVVWVGLCWLNLEERLLAPLGLASVLGLGERAAYDPFTALGESPIALVGFLAVRFLGLVVVVAVIEEFFLRGFLTRFFAEAIWWQAPLNQRPLLAYGVAVGYGLLSHPAEIFAAAAWFALVTWLMLRTRNLWDCVAAHAVTNLGLGIYVVSSEQWSLW